MSECCFTVKLSRASGRWQFFNVPLEETTSEAWLVIQKDKGKGSVEQLAGRPAVAATGTQVPYGITQCYLPPSRGDIPAFTPVEAGTRFSDPGGMQGWVDLRGWLERWFTRITVTHHGLTIGVRNLPRSFYAVVPGRDPNPRPLNRESDVLPQHHDARDSVSRPMSVIKARETRTNKTSYLFEDTNRDRQHCPLTSGWGRAR